MNQNIETALKQAFDLIEAGDLENAKSLLRPILESEKDNADVWWLYSHAVTDAETARLALNNVLRIEPDYPDAHDLLTQLEDQQKSAQVDDILEMEKDPVFIPPMPASIPGISPIAPRSEFDNGKNMGIDDELPDDMFDENEPEPFYRRPMFYVPLISLLLLGALAIVIFKPFAVNSPAPQATISNAQSSSLETPTSELIIGAADATATTDVNSTVTTEVPSDFASILSAFNGYTLPSAGAAEIIDTSIGKTLSINICTSAGKEMRELLPKAMETLAKVSPSYENKTQAIAVRMLDCTANSTLLWIGADIQDAAAFVGSTMSSKDFQSKWQPVK